jgi:hypothetical protein
VQTSANDRSIDFRGKTLCFTGQLADLKRADAQREARARGGLTQDVVNQQLDFLVVGSIPATGWKYGNYGNKIAKAMVLVQDGRARPIFVSESEFMDALAQCVPTNSGEIDGKVQVLTYTFFAASLRSFDRATFEAVLGELKGAHRCCVRLRITPARAYNELFNRGAGPAAPDGFVVIEVRACRQTPIETDGQAFADLVGVRFVSIDGVSGSVRWFERTEGSADYIRLMRDIPDELKVPDL